jgi:hypothetical protein
MINKKGVENMDEIKISKKEAQELCEYVCYLDRVAETECYSIGNEFSQDSEDVFLKLLHFAETCERGFDEYIEIIHSSSKIEKCQIDT